jgi:hypothetical protein
LVSPGLTFAAAEQPAEGAAATGSRCCPPEDNVAEPDVDAVDADFGDPPPLQPAARSIATTATPRIEESARIRIAAA